MTKKVKKFSFSGFLSWVFAVIFGLLCLVAFSASDFVMALAFWVMGVVLLPPLNRAVKEKFNFTLTKGIKSAVIIICLIVLMIAAVNSRDEVEDEEAAEAVETITDTQPTQITQPTQRTAKKEVYFTFIDEEYGCELDGEFLFNDNRVGPIKDSNFTFTVEQFKAYRADEDRFCVNGVFSNCDYDGWRIDTNCWTIILNESSFDGSSGKLGIRFLPRNPYNFAMTNFVRPDDVKWYLDTIGFEGGLSDIEDDIDRIHRRMSSKSYIYDVVTFGKDHWRLPNETLGTLQVDCEDWSTTFLSLLKAYEPSLKCYNMLAPGHLTTVCKIKDKYYIFDQKEIKISTVISPGDSLYDRKRSARSWLNSYFRDYGFKAKYKSILAVFDEKDYIAFNDTNEFIEWVLDI